MPGVARPILIFASSCCICSRALSIILQGIMTSQIQDLHENMSARTCTFYIFSDQCLRLDPSLQHLSSSASLHDHHSHYQTRIKMGMTIITTVLCFFDPLEYHRCCPHHEEVLQLSGRNSLSLEYEDSGNALGDPLILKPKSNKS